MSTLRQARVAEMIKRDLVELLQKDMRDPRLALTTVTQVEVTRDFLFAKVFVSVMGTPEEKAAAVKALQGAAGFLKGRLGRMLELRSVPTLAFRLDEGIERGIQMFEVLKNEAEFSASLGPISESEKHALEEAAKSKD
jgi:ribosome-binding factor A